MTIFYKKILLFIVFMSIHFLYVRGQNIAPATADSIKKVLATSKEDSNKVSLLLTLAERLGIADTAAKLFYANSALSLAQKIHWDYGQMEAYRVTGVIYQMGTLNYSKAVLFYEKGLSIAQKIHNRDRQVNLLSSLAECYKHLNQYAKVIEHLKEALDVQEREENKVSIWGNMGSAYADLGDYSKAIDCYEKALSIQEHYVWSSNKADKGDSATYAMLLVTIGDMYISTSQYDKALANYDSAARINTGLNIPLLSVLLYISKGNLYTKKNDHQKAVEYYEQGLNVAKANKQEENEADLLNRLSNIYFETGDLAKAMDYAKQSLAIATQKNNGKQLCETFITLGRINAGLNKNADAVSYLKNALQIAVRSGMLRQESESWDELRKVYKQMHEPAMALDAYEHYIATRDSLFNQEKAKEMTRKEMQSDFEKQKLADKIKLQRQQILTYSGFGGLVLLVLLSFVIFRNYNREKKANAIIQSEKEKSDELLLNILPVEVAEELKAKGNVQAKEFESVTVMFTDFVNFTAAGEKLGAQALVSELDACFVAFDQILAQYNIEKIKTVGDAYLAVSGLPIANPDHAADIIKAAVEIRDFMRQRRHEKGNDTFELRIGVHSGPVVAGIVGVRKFAYDIWGDTVNIAARMEQSSHHGKINVSDATHELVKDRFSFTYRGEVDAKNKGKMKMYFVE